MITVGYDILRDDGAWYVHAMREVGVRCDWLHLAGTVKLCKLGDVALIRRLATRHLLAKLQNVENHHGGMQEICRLGLFGRGLTWSVFYSKSAFYMCHSYSSVH